MRVVYYIEDDEACFELLNEVLSKSDYQVVGFIDYRHLFDAIKTKLPDIILLDLTMSEIDGKEILRYLKSNRKTTNIPVIIVSGILDCDIKSFCLDLGADDYICKPFNIKELLCRINAVLRRTYLKDFFILDDIKLNFENQIAIINDEIISLTYKECELLNYLLTKTNKVVTKNELSLHFWPNLSKASRTIDMHIKSLRNKVFSRTKYEIKTIIKVGYKIEERQ